MELFFQIINAQVGDTLHFHHGGTAVIEKREVYPSYNNENSDPKYYFQVFGGVSIGYTKDGKFIGYPARILDIIKITKGS